MKKFTKLKLGMLLSSVLLIPSLHAIVSSAELDAAIQEAILDEATGDFYVGTAASAGNLTLAKYSPVTGTTVPVATTVHADALGLAINNLNISRSGSTTRLVFDEDTTANRITVTDGTTYGQMAADVQDGAGDGIIVDLAASPNLAFAAISNTTWGAVSSTVSAHLINPTTLVPAAAASTTAALLAVDTEATDVFSVGNAATATDAAILHWDNHLERLFLGTSVTNASAAGDGARSLAVFSVDTTTGLGLTFQPIKTNHAATWGVGNTTLTHAANNLVGVAGTTLTAVVDELAVSRMTTMLTSTGFSYLILCGGNGAAALNGNRVWAIPLVTKGFANQGSLADITTKDFGTRADSLASLTSADDTFAQVGAGACPWTVDTIPTYMQAVGDAVYISSNVNTATSDESGILYSQALFDEFGQIVAWTRWEKACPTGMGTGAADGSVSFFGVDARTGKIWSVPESSGAGQLGVRVNSWTKSTGATTLTGAVNAELGADGCYCTLSVGRSAQVLGANAQGRYSLFGGNEKVVITKTADADADPAGVYNKEQTTPPTDFSAATDFLATTLPSGAGNVLCLGYSHWASGGTNGFFFAGTEDGLYRYAITATGAGFDVNEPLMELNANTFFLAATAKSWVKITGVSGSVSKIRSIGNDVYILAHDTSGVDRLYSISTATTLAAGATVNTLAESNSTTAPISGIGRILDFEIINGIADATDEQILLVGLNGIYQSCTDGGIQTVATEALSLWATLETKEGNPVTAEKYYRKLFAPKTTNLITTVQGTRVVDGSSLLGTWDRNVVEQFCTSQDDNTEEGNTVKNMPSNYTAIPATNFSGIPQVTNMWTDGGRRFFCTSPSAGAGEGRALAYRVGTANTNMTEVQDVSTGDLEGRVIYQIDQLPNGHLVACTDVGIIVD